MNLVERTVQFQQLCYISCSVLGFSITERQNLDLVIHYSSDDVALSAVDTAANDTDKNLSPRGACIRPTGPRKLRLTPTLKKRIQKRVLRVSTARFEPLAWPLSVAVQGRPLSGGPGWVCDHCEATGNRA